MAIADDRLQDLEALMPTVNVWLKASKQIERVSHLLLNLDDHKANSRRQIGFGNGPLAPWKA